MITTIKNTTIEDESKLIQKIFFLTIDGLEIEEYPPLLDNKQYVSATENNKYGKVEIYPRCNIYYLKQYRGGRVGELLVNPYGAFAKAEDLSVFTSNRGHAFCEYINVKKDLYDNYVKYLQSRDNRYFRYCEKEILDTVR